MSLALSSPSAFAGVSAEPFVIAGHGRSSGFRCGLIGVLAVVCRIVHSTNVGEVGIGPELGSGVGPVAGADVSVGPADGSGVADGAAGGGVGGGGCAS